MSEALTPKLTREQYRNLYLQNMGKEIQNEAFNLSAMQTYLTNGDSVEEAINQSATLTQGLPLSTLRAINAVKFRTTVENSTAAVQPMNLKEQQFIYVAADSINQLLRAGYMGDGQRRVTPQIFRQVVSDMMKGALGQIPTYANPLIPSAVEGDNQTASQVQNTQVDNDIAADFSAPEGRVSRHKKMFTRGGFEYGQPSLFTPQQAKPVPAFPEGTDFGFSSADTARFMQSNFADPNRSIDDYNLLPMSHEQAKEEFDAKFGGPSDSLYGNELYDEDGNRLELADAPVSKGKKKVVKSSQFSDVTNKAKKTGKKLFGRGYGPPIGRDSVSPYVEGAYQRSIRGSGLMVNNRPMAQFGNYMIDMEDLKNNQLSLFTQKGNKQKKIPRAVIGGNVSNVIKSLVVGQRPKPKDILSLSEDERDYLNGVGMAAKIEDLRDMPTKKKTEMQKEMHEFEVLRGQIAAGNDNKELVQDFKKKLLKMIHGKKVSKAQGHDLLLELAAMGI